MAKAKKPSSESPVLNQLTVLMEAKATAVEAEVKAHENDAEVWSTSSSTLGQKQKAAIEAQNATAAAKVAEANLVEFLAKQETRDALYALATG